MNAVFIRTALFAVAVIALMSTPAMAGCDSASCVKQEPHAAEDASEAPASEESAPAQNRLDGAGEGSIDLENGIVDVDIPCHARVQVTAYDPVAYEVTVRALSWEGVGIVDGMPQGTEAVFKLDGTNYPYGEDPQEGDELIASWVAKPDEMPHGIDSFRTLGDFWYQTALPWPNVWIESAAKGEFSEEDIPELVFEDLMRQ